MISRMRRILSNETLAHGIRSGCVRALVGMVSATNARILGWKDGRLPIGSRILGSRRIAVSPGFRVAGKVWFEAVTEYSGVLHEPSIRIGRNFRGSGQIHLTAIDLIDIGDDCLFGTNIFVSDHGHGSYRGDIIAQSDPFTSPSSRPLVGHGPVKIGDRCWIGDNVAILQGVEIGAGSIIGANSVLTKDVPANSIAVGVPALVIRHFSEETGRWLPSE